MVLQVFGSVVVWRDSLGIVGGCIFAVGWHLFLTELMAAGRRRSWMRFGVIVAAAAAVAAAGTSCCKIVMAR